MLRMEFKTIFTLFLLFITAFLTACSGSAPSKQGSIWEQRRDSTVMDRAPELDYKQALSEVDESSQDLEKSYQAQAKHKSTDRDDMAAQNDTSSSELADSVQKVSIENEILAMPASVYTVQVFASIDIDRVYKFADQHQLSVQYIVPTMRDSAVWYVLLLDIYPDYQAAKAAWKRCQDQLIPHHG